MGVFDVINTAGSGLSAERLRMDVIANNLANANSTRTEDGGPYMRKVVNLEPREENESSFDLQLEEMTGLSIPSADFPSVSIGGGDGFSTDSPGNGVRVRGIEQADGEPRRVYEPDHPDADEEGYVLRPNVEPVKEMVDMITATRAYEANVTTIESAKNMFRQGIQIAR